MAQVPDHSRTLRAFIPALALLAISFLINYVDRGNISIAAPLLKTEFHISDSELGILFSTFFVTYTAMQFIIGWLVDRFDANRILAFGFLLWSLATATTGIVRGFALLLVMRFILGIGESVALPAGSKILAQHLTEHHRGFASGVVMCALKCGNAVGTLGAGLLMAKFGWRPVFIWIGLSSLLWLPAWMKWQPRDGQPLLHSVTADDPKVGILLQRSFWGTSAGHFCSNYLFYFMITWLPSYLVRERHLSLTAMTGIAGLFYSVDAGSAFLSGWLQDVFIRMGHTPTLVRKSAMAIAFSVGAVGVVGCAIASANSYVPWLLGAAVGCGMSATGLYTFPQTLAGARAVGKWYGWQNGFANFAGVIGPALTGFVLQHTGSFLAPFAITAAICLFGILAWVFIVGRVEPVDWSAATRRATAAASINA